MYNGLFRYVLDLSSIDWTAGQALYLEVKVESDILTPREEIYAYPYAINSHLLEGATKEYFLNTSGETQKKDGGLNIMGNVGIGTTSPQAKLHVEGQAIIAGGLKPDYDSGWFAINATSNQTHTLNHNLGSIPTKVAIYVANSSTPTWVQPCNFLSRAVNYQSPENVWMSNTQFIVNICWADPAIYVDANNPAPPSSGIVTTESGYMRVLLWK